MNGYRSFFVKKLKNYRIKSFIHNIKIGFITRPNCLHTTEEKKREDFRRYSSVGFLRDFLANNIK